MASLQTIARQIEREGRAWGLFPEIRTNRVCVCELVYEMPRARDGCPVIPFKSSRVVASLDENSGMDAFACILRFRIQRHEHDFGKKMMAARAAEKAKAQAEIDDKRAQFRNWLRRSNNRIMTVGAPAAFGIGG